MFSRFKFLFLAAGCLALTLGVAQAESQEKPIARYWMSVATSKTTMPGMSEEMPLVSKLLGKVTGAPLGTQRTILLQLNSRREKPQSPQATHDIPPGQNMGPTLPLVIPPPASPGSREAGPGARERPRAEQEPPRVRILFYWGCGEEIGPGQPRVIDTARMDQSAFAKAMVSRSGSPQYPPSPGSGRIYADWPNQENQTEVPGDSSLVGEHLVHGNYLPEMRFALGPAHDLMKPVVFSAVKGGLKESLHFEWAPIPTAIGYFALVTARVEKTGEMIVWSSSDVFEPGWGLMDYLPSQDVRRFIREKIILPASVTSCTIPRGIFKEAEAAVMQFIAWGDDFYASSPPRPKDAPESWRPDWTVKARFKSTGTLMLGQEMGPQKEPEESPLDKVKGLFGK